MSRSGPTLSRTDSEPEPASTGRRLLVVARWTFVAIVVGFFVRVVARNTSELHDVSLHAEPAWLLAAAPLTFAGGAALPLAWRELLSAYGPTFDTVAAIRIWWFSQVTRFVPGGLVPVASRAAMAGNRGVSRGAAAVTAAIEIVVIVACGAVLAGALLPASSLAFGLRLVLLAGGAVAIVGLPITLPRLSELAGRWRRLRLATPARPPVERALVLYLLNALLKSAGFVLLAAALLPARVGDTALLAGAFNVASVAGTVGVTPAGLGVREAVMASVLRDRFGLGDAAAVAVALRVWDLAFELLWLAIAGARSRGQVMTAANVVDDGDAGS